MEGFSEDPILKLMRGLLQENMSSIRSCSTALSNLSYVPPTQEVRASETFNKSGLLTAHRIAVFNAMQLFEEGEGTDEDPSFSIKLKHSVVEMNPPPQLQKIGPILMSELKLGHIHRGSILYGTLCARAFKMTSVMTLLEDDAGHAIKLAIYNAVPSASRSSQVEALFPEGFKVAIKEPYFKRYKDCTVGLRVDHPGNVVFLTTGHESPLSMNCCKTDLECDALRLEGNRLFAKGHSREAITLYSKSIIAAEKMQSGEDRKQKTTICQKDTDTYAKSSDDGTDKYMPVNCKSSKHENKKSSASTANTTINSALLMAYSNRAEAFLRQQMYREALSDAEKALELDNCHLKSLYRKARALFQLKLYNQATACLRLAINVDPDNKEFQKLLVESISSEQQGRLGSFDLSEYFLRNFLEPVPMCADYMGPVKVQCMPFKHGRGVVVCKDVVAGDLLSVSNPLAIARVEGNNDTFYLDPVRHPDLYSASQEDLISQLYNHASTSARVLQQLYSLYDGEYRSDPPSLDLLVPQTDVILTSSSGGIDMRPDSSGGSEILQPDISRIRRIVRWNAFNENGCAVKARQQHGVSNMQELHSSGLWYLPSFINHSCCPNASRVHVGDAMMIHAAKNMNAGEEICLPYFDICRPIQQRSETSEKRWGFRCKCQRCTLEEKMKDSLEEASKLQTSLEKQMSYRGSAAAFATLFIQRSDLGLVEKCFKCVQKVEAALASLHLSPQEENWIRASHILAYIPGGFFSNSEDNEIVSLDNILNAMISVYPADWQTLKIAALVAEVKSIHYGKKSISYKKAMDVALNLVRCTFGNQYKQHVLESLFKAALLDR